MPKGVNFVILCTSYLNSLVITEELLFSAEIRKNDITCLEKTTGIQIREVAKILDNIQNYHGGVYRHSLNVGYLTAKLAVRLGLSKKEVYLICIGALFHDIGKTRIPHSILDKPCRLSPDEWELIKEHPKVGLNLVSKYDWAQHLEPMILLHHERFDGKGYYSVAPKEIPLSARMVSIADAFDAMTSDRPYQKKLNINDCWLEMERCGGTQFDPELLREFRSIMGSIDDRSIPVMLKNDL